MTDDNTNSTIPTKEQKHIQFLETMLKLETQDNLFLTGVLQECCGGDWWQRAVDRHKERNNK